jgi:hypothetical protein
MSIALSALVSRLQADVPARNGVPSSAQYGQAVKDAVADYTSRRPLRKLTTLSIVSGTATYDLPDDFQKVIRLESLLSQDGVIHSCDGLIPVSATYEENYYIVAGQITFDPTPQYTVSRDLWYAAKHTLDGSDEYPDMSEDDAGVLLLKAQARCLALQANKAAQEAWQYAIGDERVNKEKLAESLRNQAKALEQEYKEAVKTSVGPIGMRASYNSVGQ